jgi:hypothetical protein
MVEERFSLVEEYFIRKNNPKFIPYQFNGKPTFICPAICLKKKKILSKTLNLSLYYSWNDVYYLIQLDKEVHVHN